MRELYYTVNSFSAANNVLEHILDKYPDIDIEYHNKQIESYFKRAVTSKKQRTRKKYRKKLVEYHGEIRKSLRIKQTK